MQERLAFWLMAVGSTNDSGFSMRIPGGLLPFTSSKRTRTVAQVSAAVPLNSVSPWLACTSPR
jgi:hypothetical protein